MNLFHPPPARCRPSWAALCGVMARSCVPRVVQVYSHAHQWLPRLPSCEWFDCSCYVV